jgi:hypothetical protein
MIRSDGIHLSPFGDLVAEIGAFTPESGLLHSEAKSGAE